MSGFACSGSCREQISGPVDGDYGAMEYDTAEQHWYIESEDGWVPLPDSYDTSGLWYIEE